MVLTDHPALVGLWAKEIRDVENLRLQKLREKMMGYDAEIVYTPGKYHFAADALSRNPLFNVMTVEEDIMAEVYHCKRTYTGSHTYARDDLKMQPLFEAADDSAYQLVVTAVRSGIKLDDLHKDHPAQIFKSVWDDISVIDEKDKPLLILNDTRIIVPKNARKEILRKLHTAHNGTATSTRTASSCYYWQG